MAFNKLAQFSTKEEGPRIKWKTNIQASMETFKENKEAIREIIFVNDYKRQWTNTSITYKELQINKNKSSKPIEK